MVPTRSVSPDLAPKFYEGVGSGDGVGFELANQRWEEWSIGVVARQRLSIKDPDALMLAILCCGSGMRGGLGDSDGGGGGDMVVAVVDYGGYPDVRAPREGLKQTFFLATRCSYR